MDGWMDGRKEREVTQTFIKWELTNIWSDRKFAFVHCFSNLPHSLDQLYIVQRRIFSSYSGDPWFKSQLVVIFFIFLHLFWYHLVCTSSSDRNMWSNSRHAMCTGQC